MKLLKRFMLPLIAVFLLSGCIEYNIKVKVNPDGSGVVKETVILGKGMVEMLNAFAAWGGEDAEEIDIYDEDELRRQANEYGEGVKFVEGKKVSDKGREGYTAIYKFNDITKLRIDQDPDKKIPADFSEGEVDDDDPITFGFSKGIFSTLTIDIPGEFEADDFDLEDEDMEAEEMEELEDMLRDLRINICVEINGSIAETNATYIDDEEITLMQFDMGKILDNPAQYEYLKKQKPRTKEEVKELLDKIPGLKIELENKVKVKFK